MATTNAVGKALYAKLAGASAITNLLATSTSIYDGVAPDTADFPFLIFHKQSGIPTYTFGDKAWDTHVWLVKAVTRDTTSTTAEAIAAAIDSTLVNASLTITGGTLQYLRRDSDVDYIEVDGDQQYRHHGATYRLIAS